MFAGLQDSNLDAYLPERASSNMYTRPRLEVKQWLLGLAPRLQASATARATSLEVRASDERPSIWNKHSVTAQWLFLWRDDEARRHLEAVLDLGRSLAATLTDPTPFERHAFLAVCIDATGVEVSLRVHDAAWVDKKNLQARVADPLARAALLQALWSAGDVRVGVTDGPSFGAKDIDGVRLEETLAALHEKGWWFVRALRSDRGDAIARGDSLTDDLAAAFERLLPLYNLIAWSRENDLVSVEREIQAAEAARVEHEAETAAREDAWRAAHDAEIHRAREVAELRSHERAAALVPARPSVVQQAVQHVVRAAAPEPVAAQAPRAPRPTARAPKPVDVARAPAPQRPAPAKSLGVGARVLVREGPFAGRQGIVIALDSKGGARVNFGLLSARVELSEITTELK